MTTTQGHWAALLKSVLRTFALCSLVLWGGSSARAQDADTDWAKRCKGGELSPCLYLKYNAFLIAAETKDGGRCFLRHTRLSQRSAGVQCVVVDRASIDDTMIFVLDQVESRSGRTHAYRVSSAYWESQKLLRKEHYRLSYMTRKWPGAILVSMNPDFDPTTPRSSPDKMIYELWGVYRPNPAVAPAINAAAIVPILSCDDLKLTDCQDAIAASANDQRWMTRLADIDGKPSSELRVAQSTYSDLAIPDQYFIFIPVWGYRPPSLLIEDRPYQESRINPDSPNARTVYQKLEYPAQDYVAELTERGPRVTSVVAKRSFPDTAFSPAVDLNREGVRIGLTWSAKENAFVLDEQLGASTQLLRLAPFEFENERTHLFNKSGEGDFALVRPDNGQTTNIVVALDSDGTVILNEVGYKENTSLVETRPLCVGDAETRKMVPCEEGSRFDLTWDRR